MRHLELFSGIGGFRRAMDLLTEDKIMDFECAGYSEIDGRAKHADFLHDGKWRHDKSVQGVLPWNGLRLS